MTERMTVLGFMTDKMTAWSKMQCGATYEVSNDLDFFVVQLMNSAMIWAFWGQYVISAGGWAQSCYFRRFSIVCHLLSSNAMDLVNCHYMSSPMMPMLTINNRDQTRQKKLLNQSDQSLSSGAQYRFGQAKQFWYLSYLQCGEYVRVGHVVLMVINATIDQKT